MIDLDSDKHNFSKSVHKLNSGYIAKPRSVFLEEKIYSENSTFRLFLELHSPIGLDCLPRLVFRKANYGPGTDESIYEYIDVNPVNRLISNSEAEQIGAVLALMALLGVKDLHKSNIIFGISQGKIVFAPIDLEIFFHFTTEVKLVDLCVADAHHLECCSGLGHLISYLKEFSDYDIFSKIIFGFYAFLNAFKDKEKDLEIALFNSTKKSLVVSRIVLAPTIFYYNTLKSPSTNSFNSLLDSEIIQLKRGDIPYYFSFLSKPKIVYYWANKDESKKAETKYFETSSLHSSIPPTCIKKSLYQFADLIFKAHLGSSTLLSKYKNLIVRLGKTNNVLVYGSNIMKLNKGKEPDPTYNSSDNIAHLAPFDIKSQFVLASLSLKGLTPDLKCLENKNDITQKPYKCFTETILQLYNVDNNNAKLINDNLNRLRAILDELNLYTQKLITFNELNKRITPKLEFEADVLNQILKENKSIAISIYIPFLYTLLAIFPFHEFTQLSDFYRSNFSNKKLNFFFTQLKHLKKSQASKQKSGIQTKRLIELRDKSYNAFWSHKD